MRRESRPAATRRQSRTEYSDPTVLPGHQRHEPPDAEDRADAALLAAAAERGYRLAVQCLICGSRLTNPRSIAAHIGPKCRAKMAADV